MSLGAIIADLLRLWREMRVGGLSPEQADQALEKSIRDVWPKGREEPWHYVCELCNDTGLRLFVCRRGQRCNGISTRTDAPKETPGKYKRLCAKHPDSEYEHDYVTPCLCERGDGWRDKPKAPADFAEAGKTAPKPRKFSRFGE